MNNKSTGWGLVVLSLLAAVVFTVSEAPLERSARLLPELLEWISDSGIPGRDTPADADIGSELTGTVVEVTDGDTLELRDNSRQIHTIRLHGIDTPEWNQRHGTVATAVLTDKLNNRQVSVTVEDIDTYDRLVGVVFLDDRNINLEMVQEGHAWWYEYYASDKLHLQRAQQMAQQQQLGLWALSDPDPIPPWQWRRRQ